MSDLVPRPDQPHRPITTRRVHPLDLSPDAVRSIRDLTQTAAQQAAAVNRSLTPRPNRPTRVAPCQHVEIHRVELARPPLLPWLGTLARVTLIALACAGIISLGIVVFLTYVAWMGNGR